MKSKIDTHFYMKLMAIALPLALQNLITSSLNLIDVFMISSLSTSSIAGVSLANKVFFLLALMMFGIGSGSAVLTAQYWGIKDIKNIKRVLGLCLAIGVAGATLFALAAIFLPNQVMRIFTPDPEVIAQGAKYLRIVGIAYLPTSITFAYVAILRSTGRTLLPMYASVFALLLNTFLNYTLIYGHFGAPALGVKGAAIATVISRIVEFLILITTIYFQKYDIAANLMEMVDWNKAFIKKYFKTVTPVILNELSWAFGVTMYDLVYGRMGQVATATMGITKTVEQVAFFMIYSVGNAAGVILGNEIGSGDLSKVFIYTKRLMKLVLIIGAVMSLILLALSNPISKVFDVEPEVRMYISLTVKVLAAAMILKGMNMLIVVGILRSGGDTTFCMLLDSGAVWLIAVPLVWLVGIKFGWEIHMVYLVSLSEELSKLFVGLWRTKSMKWINNLVS